MQRSSDARRVALALTLAALGFYATLNYGGTRSPDSEIVFRTAESLARDGSFALDADLELWSGFGAPQGRDGRQYSLFGPGQALAAAPPVAVARLVNRTGWYRGWDGLPISHYHKDGILRLRAGARPAELEPHATRFLVSFLNPVVTALAVLVFFHAALAMTGSVAASGAVAALFAFGSPMLIYSGTFFSEPLATLFALLSFLYLYRGATASDRARKESLLAGLFLGIAVGCHIIAILLAPFFALILAGAPASWERGGWKSRLEPLGAFAAGFALPVLLLLYFNYARFGDPLETGRGLGDPESLGYGSFTAPWSGLSGLLWSAGKGLAWFSPLSLLGLAVWGRLLKLDRFAGWTLLAAVLFWLVFVAARTDWHGGFSPGPRLTVVTTPFFLLPVAAWSAENLRAHRVRTVGILAVALVLTAAVQLYLSTGEIFSYYHTVRDAAAQAGVDVFRGEALYREPALSPFGHLLDGLRGPWSLKWLPMSNRSVWLLLTATFAALALLGSRWLERLAGEETGVSRR